MKTYLQFHFKQLQLFVANIAIIAIVATIVANILLNLNRLLKNLKKKFINKLLKVLTI